MTKKMKQDQDEDLIIATDDIRVTTVKKTYYFQDIINLSNVNELPNFTTSSLNCLKYCNIHLNISPSKGLLSHQYKSMRKNIFKVIENNRNEEDCQDLSEADGDFYKDILINSTFFKTLLKKRKNYPLETQNVTSITGRIMRWDDLETPAKFTQPVKNQSINPQHQSLANNLLEIKVKKTGSYRNNSKVLTYYTQSPKNRGILLLVNNIDFREKRRIRNGAIVDQANIVELFTQLGFVIVEEKNKTKSEMQEIVQSFASNPDLYKYDMCITIVMSHGGKINGQTVIESIDEKNLSTKWIVEQFYGYNCKGMIDKPKIFIFQCCRNPINVDKDSYNDSYSVQRRREIEDILICYSTIEDFSAYRDPRLGSWYITDLCQVFMEHAHDTDIERLLKMVDQKLRDRNHKDIWQTSNYESLGFKLCYLNPC
nr:caspase Dronc-like [Onthophagus taurus]